MTRRPTPTTVKTTICAANIRSFMDLSTAHLPETSRQSPDCPAKTGSPRTSCRTAGCVDTDLPAGVRRATPTRRPQVRAMQRYARGLGCNYLLFDVGDLASGAW